MAEALLQYLRLFTSISNDDAGIIAAHVQCRAVTEGEVLLREGTIAREIFFICKGVLKIVTINDKGNEVTYFFLKENQFCTILHSFDNEVAASEGIKAACDAVVLVITKSRLLNLYRQLPYMKELIERITRQRLLDKIQLRNAYLGKDSASRYELFMLQQPDIALQVPLSDIASYLGITPQSLSRIRKNNR